jgi:hypothetical protein
MAGRGGLRRTSWKPGVKVPGRGRPKGSRDVVPRSEKASIRDIAADIILNHPDVIRESLMRGFAASPPKSLPYLTLAASLIGEGIEQKLQVTGPDGGPVQLEAVQTEQLRLQVRERLTRLLEASSVIDVTPRVPPLVGGNGNGNGNGNGQRSIVTST